MANARKFVALGGMIGILVLAWWFDRLYEFAHLGVGPFARLGVGPVVYPNPLLWVSALTNWALAGLVLLLAWFVIFKHGGSALVFLIFLLVGLLVMFSFFLEAPLAEFAPLPYQPLTVFLPVSPRSLTFHASAFIAVIGVIGLLIWTADHRPLTALR